MTVRLELCPVLDKESCLLGQVPLTSLVKCCVSFGIWSVDHSLYVFDFHHFCQNFEIFLLGGVDQVEKRAPMDDRVRWNQRQERLGCFEQLHVVGDLVQLDGGFK